IDEHPCEYTNNPDLSIANVISLVENGGNR
ncbi:hypothetical protein PSY30_23920, partial [Shigella flexneri]|nr:hypothetical protein [Shigella flexneri]